MKSPRNFIRKIHRPALILFIWTATALGQYGQHERIVWTKQDADPYLNVAFSTNGLPIQNTAAE